MWWRRNSLTEAGKAMLAESFAHLENQQKACTAAWGLGTCKRWDADFIEGTIRFTTADDRIVTAPMQIVGSYRPSDSSWEWAWDDPSIHPRLAEHARLARDYASKFKLKSFDTRVLKCSQGDAWQFAAVACMVGGADGVYRGPSNDLLMFMTFGPVVIEEPPVAD